MALIPEDGTGRADADTYATLAEFRAYWSALGVDYASTADGALEPAMRRAAIYLDAVWGGRFGGYRSASAQARAWPRIEASDADGWPIASGTVPREVKDAQCELAREALTAELSPAQERGGAVVEKEIEVKGAVRTRTRWKDSAPAGRTFPRVGQALSRLLVGPGGGFARVVRA